MKSATGIPQDIASITVLGKLSSREGAMKISAAEYISQINLRWYFADEISGQTEIRFAIIGCSEMTRPNPISDLILIIFE